ncbi:sensor histidine kinase [Streptomyces lavendulae]|uniref:sensor histidine kinase n=1 Tax=Streptomyces lavendulae TaxID=1914 RepID=UPI0024A600F6|nr:sensor histidine kinase [Streptomyces lavendulae]GLX16945.1 two-component sensor histidine kinase [Streptomyces lavendulae subsp. lavendulae]GLX29452.1 two-component sensor histidine kinase [Streptomyces lavendulae subsp. lavendulae]
MLQRPRRGDPFWIWTLHWWEGLSWALIALVTLITLVGDAPPRTSYGMPVLVAVLALGYALVRFRPGNPVLRPYGYLWLLVAVLGGLSYVGDGLGVFYTVTLAQFVVFADTVGAAVLTAGLGAVAITVGGTLREGWSAEVLTTNTISSLAVFAVGVLISAVTPRALALRDERALLRADLETAQRELVEAYQRQGAAEERERLAREIHDTLAQGFASIVVLAEAARSALVADPARSAQQLRSIEQTARENLAEARVLVGAAPLSGVAAGSVAATLRRTLDRFAEDTGLTVTAELADVACDQPTRVALLRCTQESLANIRKHAAASAVGVVLASHQGGVELEITDDGRGFVVGESRGFGLDGMRGRLAEFGGELTVTSSVGDGTRVLAVIPTNGQV